MPLECEQALFHLKVSPVFCALFKMKEQLSTKYFHLAYKYYKIILCCPTSHSFKNGVFKTVLNKSNMSRLLAYFAIKALQIVNLLQIIKLILEAYLVAQKETPLDVFTLFAYLFWLVAMSPILLNEYFLNNNAFNFSLKRLFKFIENNLTKPGIGQGVETKIKSTLNIQLLLICIHNIGFDYFNVYNAAATMYGNLEYDPTFLYLAVPWKDNNLVNTVYWLVLLVNVHITDTMFSLLFTLPGVIAYYLEATIKILTARLNSCENWSEFESVLKEYKNLEYCVRDGIDSQLGSLLLVFFGCAGLMQFIEAFFIFQFIKLGVPWEVYQFFVFDIFVADTRLFHSFYALSRLYLTAQEFLESVARVRSTIVSNVPQVGTTNKNKKLMGMQILQLKHISMRKGPCICGRNMPMKEMAGLLDLLVTAALWP